MKENLEGETLTAREQPSTETGYAFDPTAYDKFAHFEKWYIAYCVPLGIKKEDADTLYYRAISLVDEWNKNQKHVFDLIRDTSGLQSQFEHGSSTELLASIRELREKLQAQSEPLISSDNQTPKLSGRKPECPVLTPTSP